MNDLFVRVYLDEDVSVLIAKLLQSRGYEALTAKDAGRVSRSDAEQLQFASDIGMAILTHNRRHFDLLAKQWLEENRSHAGIIIAVRRKPHELARRLLILLDSVTADEMNNQVRYI